MEQAKRGNGQGPFCRRCGQGFTPKVAIQTYCSTLCRERTEVERSRATIRATIRRLQATDAKLARREAALAAR